VSETSQHPQLSVPDNGSLTDTGQRAFTYDAFISYSGFRKVGEATQLDETIARRLHKSLECYRVPRSLRKRLPDQPHRARLKKIFLDRDEVRVSNSLNDRLTEALRESRFLIVICSPRARQSRWINQEIAIFRSFGKDRQILPLLIEGEPAEAFPEAIFGNGSKQLTAAEELTALPLAADIRAPSLSTSLRLLKHERLRLLATIIGCEYDDLRRREQERFIKRVMSGGVAMLVLLLVLSTLSVWLFLEQRRSNRNAQLALNASAEILPLIALDPAAPAGANDPVIKEVHVSSAISYLETLRIDDPDNLKCLTTLRALYGAFGGLLLDRNKTTEAQEAYQKAESMVIPIALSRLRAWKPTSPTTVKAISREELAFPNTYERNRLQTLLTITEPMNGKTSIKNAQDYAELAAEYLLLLDTSTNAGKTEARRVLEVSLKKFQKAQAGETLSPRHEELIEAIKRTSEQLSK
jgi:MTH538 TIR-like domain (DUF1863).